jgi:dipeptidyl aminopeptidase/acylaminoacyl peptidase
VKTVVSTGHQDNMASWAAKQEKMVWVTDRSGASEIWLRSSDGTDRPVVTADEFPAEIFFYPALSPTGDRMIFSKLDLSGSVRLWLTSLSGGAPIRLTNADSSGEWGGNWSPDGSRFSYVDIKAGNSSIKIVKTNGGAAPLTIQQDCSNVPDWSPSGDWITCQGNSGWSLLSPDGKASKALGQMDTPYLSFSRDGKRLYGLLDKVPKTNKNGAVSSFLDISTLKQSVIKDLGTDFQPKNPYIPDIRFSMSPDGKRFLYSTGKRRQDIWMLKGFKQPSWLDRFSFR